MELVKKILQCPTAPFREAFVMNTVEEVLKTNGIPYHYDKTENLIAGWKGDRASRRKIKIAFMAHTDHPGFHVQKQIKDNVVEALWLGGAPYKKMNRAAVRIYDLKDPSWSLRGRITHVGEYNSRQGTALKIQLEKSVHVPRDAFGGFDYPGYKLSGRKVITRAADDLAGCAIQLGALIDTYHHFPGRAVAVFTRAEEIGYVGCLLAIKNKSLPRVPFVSLEASKELEGARIGKGPVLRLGDAASLFDTSISQALLMEARKLAEARLSKWKFQRRIMDGGVCEATPLNVLGYPAAGISVPLGNYHNQKPDGRPGPEIIHLDDVEGARKICGQLIRNFEPEAWTKRMKASFKEILRHNQKYLSVRLR